MSDPVFDLFTPPLSQKERDWRKSVEYRLKAIEDELQYLAPGEDGKMKARPDDE